jgi:hypothetical protein
MLTMGDDDQTVGRGDLLRLGPTIIVAIDSRGAEVAKRIASLLRANERGVSEAGDAAVRDRFSFLEITDPAVDGLATEVQAIIIEPSSQLWDVAQADWKDRAFKVEPPRSFIEALDTAVKRVLSYTDVRDTLRERNVKVRSSILNVFFVGSLVEQEMLPPPSGDDEAPAGDDEALSNARSLVGRLERQIGMKLQRLQILAEQTRDYATDSASLNMVVRGAFLAVILPDSMYIARQALQNNGTAIGRLLDAHTSQNGSISGAQPHGEPPLHFCSLHTGHDEDGAWYPPEQMANVMASAIFSLLMSELLDHAQCRGQLGLQDPYLSPYDRLITIAGTRSSFPRADLLDYAALRYGSYLIEQLIPRPTLIVERSAQESVGERALEIMRHHRLRALLSRPVGDRWDTHGSPRSLTEVARQAARPDLLQLIPYPRRRLFEPWEAFTRQALSQLEHLELLSGYLQEPTPDQPDVGYRFVDDDNRSLPLPLPDGTAITYNQREVLREWHIWRVRLDGLIGNDPIEIRSRLDALRLEIDRACWGEVPAPIRLSGITYCYTLLDQVQEQANDLRTLVESGDQPAGPTTEVLAEQLEQARTRCDEHMGLGPIAGMALCFAIVASYLLFALRDSLEGGMLGELARGADLWFTLPGVELPFMLPQAVMLGALAGLSLALVGALLRQLQFYRATSSIKTYTQQIRRKYALQMYADEQHRLDQVAPAIEQILEFLRHTLESYEAAARATATTLIQRADQIERRGFRDVTEFIPASRGDALSIYQRLIAPNEARHATADLPELRRLAQEAGSITENVRSADLADELYAEARQRLRDLVLGEASANEHSPRAQLRHIAYRSVQRDLDLIAAQSVTGAFAERATALAERTPIMMSLSLRLGQETFPHTYIITPVSGSSQEPDLLDTTEVRSLDAQTIMYVRIVSRIWPRLFDGAEVQLTL